MITQLTIRENTVPGRKCMRFRYAGSVLVNDKCDAMAEFSFDAPGTLALNVCLFHALKLAPDLIKEMHEMALRDYDQQTTRLRALGKPCKVCGVRREEHTTPFQEPHRNSHQWTDDEDDAEAYERDHK